MKLQQLRYLCTIVDESLSITRAATKLHTSQPGVSKQLRLLEEELAAKLFVRRSNRTLALSATGHAILPLARRIVKDSETLKRVVRDAGDPEKGELVIATTHVHARYSLTPVLARFRSLYPGVRVRLLLGRPQQIAYWVSTGDADVAIGTAAIGSLPSLVTVPCFRLAHCIIAPPNHPLLRRRYPSLSEIAKYPLISTAVDSNLTTLITDRCAALGLRPNIVIYAAGIEIVKKYVEIGLGIAVMPTIAVELKAERKLRVIDATHVFEPAIVSVITQDDLASRQYISDFVEMVAPKQRGKRAIRELPARY